MSRSLPNIGTLDGLRGYAVLFVLVAHFPPITDSAMGTEFRKLTEILQLGYVGVDIFFALSGFLITRILISEKKSGTISFKRFYLKRALRIFPIYYLTILAVGILITWDKMNYVAIYISNYYFSFNPQSHPMKHTWSLCVEEHFYLIWPLVLYMIPLRISKFIVMIAIPILAIIAGVFTFQLFDESLAYNLLTHGTLYRILTLSLGSAIAFYEERLISIRTWFLALFAGAIPALIFLGKIISNPVLTMICIGLISVLILIIVLRLNNLTAQFIVLGKLFTNRVIKYFGRISYGIYLFHYPILYYMGFKTDVKYASYGMALVSLLLCIGIPTLSYYWIENPLLKLKSRLH